MANDTQHRSGLTPKGERVRARIIAAAAELIHERGVAGTTLEDVKAAAQVSGSQLYHYFGEKETLVQAVIDWQADVIVGNTEQADLGSIEGLRAWRDMVIAAAKTSGGMGGCPLGSLGSQLAERDPEARTRIAAGFGRWSAAIRDGLRALHAAGHLPAGISPDDLAVTLLAALQGGLLLAQVQRDTRPLETAVDTILALASAGSELPAGSQVAPRISCAMSQTRRAVSATWTPCTRVTGRTVHRPLRIARTVTAATVAAGAG
jgi:AcrR family transcriptional regulator